MKKTLGLFFLFGLLAFFFWRPALDFVSSVIPAWNTNWNYKAIADRKIGVQAYQGFSKSLSAQIKQSLEKTYGIPVYMLPERKLPASAFVHIKSPRYRADSLLRDLKAHKPDTLDHVLGLCTVDISTTKRDASGAVKEPRDKYLDWGVFGLGYRPGPSCVISSFRLHRAPATAFYERIEKISIHEIGHNLGLEHCETPQCVMADAAEKLSTVDGVKAELCERCKRKIGLP